LASSLYSISIRICRSRAAHPRVNEPALVSAMVAPRQSSARAACARLLDSLSLMIRLLRFFVFWLNAIGVAAAADRAVIAASTTAKASEAAGGRAGRHRAFHGAISARALPCFDWDALAPFFATAAQWHRCGREARSTPTHLKARYSDSSYTRRRPPAP